MFKGNAKTHFQSLGKSSSNNIGFMMSPFGDDRWDADDREKLRKFFNKSDFDGFVKVNENAAQKYARPAAGAKSNSEPFQAATPLNPNVVVQSPKAEIIQNQQQPVMYHQGYYQMPPQQLPPEPCQVVTPKQTPAVEPKPRMMLTQPTAQNVGNITICKECHEKLSSGACRFSPWNPNKAVLEASAPVAERAQYAEQGQTNPDWALASGEKSVRGPTEHLPTNMGTVGSHPGSARTSAECSLASSRESSTTNVPYKVVMLGSAGVGKSSLISQFMTSEYLHAYDTSLDEEYGEKSVSVLLDGEESELIFVDHPSAEMSPENCITTYQPQAYIIVYSVVDRSSFQIAEETLQSLWKIDSISSKAVILVGNKTDLVRSRTISSEEGKNMARSYDCKFIETSVGINHNVDELLVGILTQIRLKIQQATKPKRNKSPLGICIGKDNESPKKWRNSRLSASLKVKGLLGRVWARDSKSKSCEILTEEELDQLRKYKEDWLVY